MSKKTKKNKKLIKVIKPSKLKSAGKKAKEKKTDKMKPSTKTVTKKPAKQIVKKKIIAKSSVKKVDKPTAKKVITKAIKTVSKKTIGPVKKAGKEIIKKSSLKPTTSGIVKKIPNKESSSGLVKSKKLKKESEKIDDIIDSPFFDDSLEEPKKKYKRRKGGRKRKKKEGEEDEPEIIHDELVEQLLRATKKMRAQPKKPRILKTFVNPMTSLTVAKPENNKKVAIPKKEPKGKFTLEYLMNTSVAILYEFLTSPSGLVEWFADAVSLNEGVFTFVWDGSEQKAKLIGFKENEFVRLQWLDKPDGTYFEFRIQVDKTTNDVSLIITDFADEDLDLDTSKKLWDTQMEKLLHVIGSY